MGIVTEFLFQEHIIHILSTTHVMSYLRKSPSSGAKWVQKTQTYRRRVLDWIWSERWNMVESHKKVLKRLIVPPPLEPPHDHTYRSFTSPFVCKDIVCTVMVIWKLPWKEDKVMLEWAQSWEEVESEVEVTSVWADSLFLKRPLSY